MQVNSRVRVKGKGSLDGRVGTVTAVGRKLTVKVDRYAYEQEDMVAQLLPEQVEELIPMDAELRKLMAFVSSNAFLVDDKEKPKRRNGVKRHRLALRVARDLSPDQLKLLIALLDGDAALISVKGESYALRRTSVGHAVRSLEAGAPEHAIVDGRCSCEDCRLRGNECKHLKALGVLT